MARFAGSPASRNRDVQSATSVGVNPEDERKARMIKYTIAMSVRVVCLILGMVVQGWLMWVFFAAAILLPYIAVVIANDVRHEHENRAEVVQAPTLKLGAGDIKVVNHDD
ncbi:MAG: hypothetical protein RL672_1218 [Actinomycetota bacterium]|jgi:predicted tellurium resistance membrane protein TerC